MMMNGAGVMLAPFACPPRRGAGGHRRRWSPLSQIWTGNRAPLLRVMHYV